MPSGVGAPGRAVRAFAAIALVVAGLAILAAPAGAQQEPTGGIEILKVEIGGVAPATFEVTGPGLTGTAILQANVLAQNTPTPALPALPPLTPGTYVITETAPVDPSGQSVWQLTSVDCGGVPFTRNENSIQIDVVDEIITCTFTDEVTRAAIEGSKTVIGDTSSWVRPAQFHITCPDIQLDIDIEPPVGPGGPGIYSIGQGSIPPATCTITEIDTGSDGSVSVTMVMTNHGVPIAFGNTSLTFTSHAGDDLALWVTNVFSSDPGPDQPSPVDPGATTTVAGGSTTTTIAATTTSATTVPDGGATTTSGGAPTSSAPTTTAPQLPVTGSLAGGLIVFALVAMIGGVVLVARTRRLVD